MKYKVLSVRQPYASLLVSGRKDVENRSRYTKYRGLLLIHTSGRMHDVVANLRAGKWAGINDHGKKILRAAEAVEKSPETMMSAIIGSVEIVDCVRGYESEWAERDCWHWVCANAKMLERPIVNVKGKLGYGIGKEK